MALISSLNDHKQTPCLSNAKRFLVLKITRDTFGLLLAFTNTEWPKVRLYGCPILRHCLCPRRWGLEDLICNDQDVLPVNFGLDMATRIEAPTEGPQTDVKDHDRHRSFETKCTSAATCAIKLACGI